MIHLLYLVAQIFLTYKRRLNILHDTKRKFLSIGALVKGKASCSGYSAAFQLILTRMNTDTQLVVGTTRDEQDKNAAQNHMWNAVVVNGKNYYVDVTWDDPTAMSGAALSHTYFNMTGAAMKKTHTDISPSVPCTATADNYFVREGLYFAEAGSAFTRRVTEAFIKGVADKEKYIELRFSDMTVYSQGVDALIEDGGLRRAFERSGLTHSGGGYTVHYTEDTDNYILSIALKSN